MIFDTLDHFHYYCGVHPLFIHVSEFMEGRRLSDLEKGTITLYRGIYASIDSYETKPKNEKSIECHRKYIDIQMVLDGEERIGVCHKKQCSALREYDPEKDVEFLTGNPGFLPLTKDAFIILFPHDAHVPGLRANEAYAEIVKKIVFKIPVHA